MTAARRSNGRDIFPPFFLRKACQTLRRTKTRKTGEKLSVPLLRFTDVIGWFWENVKNNYKVSEKSTNKVKKSHSVHGSSVRTVKLEFEVKN